MVWLPAPRSENAKCVPILTRRTHFDVVAIIKISNYDNYVFVFERISRHCTFVLNPFFWLLTGYDRFSYREIPKTSKPPPPNTKRVKRNRKNMFELFKHFYFTLNFFKQMFWLVNTSMTCIVFWRNKTDNPCFKIFHNFELVSLFLHLQ